MKTTLLLTGETHFDYIARGIKLYQDRIRHYLPLETRIIPDLKNTMSLPVEMIKEKEGMAQLKKVTETDFVVLLDENGRDYNSIQFAKYIENKMQYSKNVVFIIGGAYGFSEEVYKRADEKISLSKMTFSHQIIRLIFFEQMYRAMTIIRGEKYHHE
ncbi:MAG: 23S rRNA (pseudouridine(1915)-N(3))-methyltransferase RlmH [Bacteroidia bacterium]|nr:23S rRNA (pseudouridine(1915)-N(3))-methyltransferase RlmH [Bacteroidia bacterium]